MLNWVQEKILKTSLLHIKSKDVHSLYFPHLWSKQSKGRLAQEFLVNDEIILHEIMHENKSG